LADYIQVDGRDVGDIKIYALSTCGWCKKAKATFNEHKIKYSYVDIDLLPMKDLPKFREEQLRHNPRGSFPTIVINGKTTIIGYDEDRLAELIGA
jgi:glutaredoxin-like protein NrdH